MKKNITNNIFGLLKSRTLLAVSAGIMMVSCGVQQMGGYSETDGVYYDPSRDTLPQGYEQYGGNRVGEYYDYQDSTNIVEQSRYNQNMQKNRYNHWYNQNRQNTNTSDWGNYAGTETIYNTWNYPSYGFGYGIGYSPYGYYGYSPYWGWNGGMSYGFGWGSGYYGYSYDPFFSYGLGIGYGYPYYSGYYSPYYGYSRYTAPYRRSGSMGGFRTNGYNGNIVRQGTYATPGFRSGNATGRTYQQNQSRIYSQQNNQNYRVFTPQNSQRQAPVYRNESSWNNSGSFRSESNSGGGFRSGGSGGFGGNSGGGMRSGGGHGGFR